MSTTMPLVINRAFFFFWHQSIELYVCLIINNQKLYPNSYEWRRLWIKFSTWYVLYDIASIALTLLDLSHIEHSPIFRSNTQDLRFLCIGSRQKHLPRAASLSIDRVDLCTVVYINNKRTLNQRCSSRYH